MTTIAAMTAPTRAEQDIMGSWIPVLGRRFAREVRRLGV
jgi:hypothetical protein